MDLHGKLLKGERHDYERLRGPVSDGEFLAVAVSNPDFSWLGALTTLIVSLDRAAGGAAGEPSTQDCMAQIHKLLTPGGAGGEFNRKYEVILCQSSHINAAHASVLRELQAFELARSYRSRKNSS